MLRLTVRRRPILLVLGAAVLGGAAVLAIIVLAGRGTPSQSAALAPPRYVEETASAGVDHRYDGDFEYFVGGGVAVFDCNDDGLGDLYLAGGSEPAGLYANVSAVGGALRFEPLPDPATDLEAVTGAYPLDIDADGVTDLAVLRIGENVLLRGLGDCRFERANEAWGFDGGDAWTTGFSATWEPGGDWPTLAFGTYLEVGSNDAATRACEDNVLVRPAVGPRGFAEAIPLRPSWCALSLLFSDWDRSGRRDLRVSNDRHYYGDASAGEEQLWRVEPGHAPVLWTREQGWQSVRIWGMGIASHDITGDGYPEVYLTSQGDNKLQTLADDAARPDYRDIALERDATAHRPFAGDTQLPSTAWHAEFQDVNNDGIIDLLVTKGNVEAMLDFAARDPSDLLIGQADGTFVEGAEDAGVVSFSRARGAALADLNLDGLLDLVIVNRREPVKLWRNVGAGDADAPSAMGDWLAIRLQQPGGNRDAIGAWVRVRAGGRTLQREVTVGGGHGGGQLGWIHFGLGAAVRAEVSVQWPDGESGDWLPVDANQFVTVSRGASSAVPWTPPGP